MGRFEKEFTTRREGLDFWQRKKKKPRQVELLKPIAKAKGNAPHAPSN